MWTAPRITVRKLADAANERGDIVLAALVGALWGYHRFALGKPLFAPDVLFLHEFWPAGAASSSFAGVVGNLVFVFVGGEVFPWVGRLFGARGGSTGARTALCWSQVPLAAMLIVFSAADLLPNVICGDPRSPASAPCVAALLIHLPAWRSILLGFGTLEVVLFLWSIILVIAAISEVLSLGLLRTLGTVALAFPLSSVLTTLLVFFFWRLS
jgi:hypothetical protein